MALNVYECVVIFDVQLADAAREAAMKELTDAVESCGGSVVETVPFGIRPLSFELKGRLRGDYRIVRFVPAGDVLQRIDKILRLKDDVLRFMVTKYYAPKPKKVRVKKQKPADDAAAEGETVDGKSEQSTADRESHAPA